MNNCSVCNQLHNTPPAAVQIVNPCEPVLFHKVTFPASLGDETTNPPDTLDYRNVILQYEATGSVYIYSSDSVPTALKEGTIGTISFDDLLNRPSYAGQLMSGLTNIPKVPVNISDLEDGSRVVVLEGNVLAIQEDITSIQTELSNTKNNLNALQSNLATTNEELNTAETNINTLQNDLTVVQETLTATTGTTDTIMNNINRSVEVNTYFTTDTSTVTVNRDKVNLKTQAETTTTDALPVANTIQAGVMNPAMFNSIKDNSDKIEVILHSSVSIAGLPADPTQEQLTTAWEGASGLTTVLNGAKINDSTNGKIWTYYTNTGEWESTAAGDTTITVSPWTNTQAGIVKGSVVDGQIFAEPNGSGSVNGWDDLKNSVSSNTTRITELTTTTGNTETAVEALQTGKQDKLTFDSVPTANSTNPVTSGGIKTALDSKANNSDLAALQGTVSGKQDTLVSGTNIKTINSQSILGAGDITITVPEIMTIDEFNAAWEAA